jgi:hypothetical protein
METNSKIRFSQDKLKLEQKPLRVNMDLYNTTIKTGFKGNTIESNKLKKSVTKFSEVKTSPRVEFNFSQTTAKKENLKFIKAEKIKTGDFRKTVKSLDFQTVKK